MIICDVACINADIGQLFFEKYLETLIWLIQKLLMSSINSVRNLQLLYFNKKNKKIKNLKNDEKNGPISAFIHTTFLID